MASFPLPKGYQRMGAFPIDETTVFGSLALLEAYATSNGTAYAGQLCAVNDGVNVTVYKINVDKTVTSIEGGTVTAIDFGVY